MTSSNTIEYTIYKGEEVVGRHRQNIMCKTCNDGLEKFQPPSDFTIQAWGYDEDDDLWEGDKRENLEEWLKKHPAQFTFKEFEVGEKVKLTKKMGEGIIIESRKGRFFPEYKVQVISGEILDNIQQGQIIPTNKI
jgi:hypothetical protein